MFILFLILLNALFVAAETSLARIRRAQLQEMQGGASKTEDERKSWDYLEWTKKDPRGLAAMEANEPDRFKKLCADFEAASRDKGLAL